MGPAIPSWVSALWARFKSSPSSHCSTEIKRQPLTQLALNCTPGSSNGKLTWGNNTGVTFFICNTGPVLLFTLQHCWEDERYSADSTQHSTWHLANHCWVAACVLRFVFLWFCLSVVSGIKHQLWGSWTKVRVSTLPFISYEILGKVFNLANIFLISKMDIITALALESRG